MTRLLLIVALFLITPLPVVSGLQAQTGKTPPPNKRLQAAPAVQGGGLAGAVAGVAQEGSGLLWSYTKDQVVEGAGTFVKNNLGVMYRLVPGGPQLPFGASREIIQAQGQRYGMKLVPVPSAEATRLSQGMNAGWEVFKLSTDIYDAYTGEEEVSTAQNRVVAATVAAEAGLGMGYMISLVPGAGAGPALLAGWAGNQVKEAVFEALDAWDAQVAAVEAEKAWKANDVRLAREKVGEIKAALNAGDYTRAAQLNRGLNSFTEERRLGMSDMAGLNAITWKLQDQIQAAAREAKAQEAQDEAAQEAEYRRKLEVWNQYWEDKKREDDAAEAFFSVRIVTAVTTVDPGTVVPVGIILQGGRPPYDLSGLITRRLGEEGEYTTSFEASTEPNFYNLSITAVDADGLERDHRVTITVEGERAEDRGVVSGLPMEPIFDLSGISVVVIHSAGRGPVAEEIAAFLRAGNAEATTRESQGTPETQAQHQGTIYASPAFMSKAHLIARQLESIEPFTAKPFAEVRGPANQLTIWLVG